MSLTLPAHTIVTDVGGTHIRFGLWDGRQITHIEKWPVTTFRSFDEALTRYQNITGYDGKDIAIATAAWPDADGVWHFAHDGRWPIRPHTLREHGWTIHKMLNDFQASSLGAVQSDLTPLTDISAPPYNRDCLVVGPGTGLGLACVRRTDHDDHVQESFGGHMAIGAQTADQYSIIESLTRLHGKPPVYEDVISGKGLQALYRIVSGTDDDILTILNDDETSAAPAALTQTCDLFHDFLGLFIQQAAVFHHAFGGIFLDGGVTHILHNKQMLDIPKLQSVIMNIHAAPVVTDALSRMPVYVINDPFIALSGLISGTSENA